MKNFFLGLTVVMSATSAMAAKAPVNSEKLLWHVSGEVTSGEVLHICMTTKNPAKKLILCFGEVLSAEGTEGYAVQKIGADRVGKDEVVGNYKITPVGKWIHLYRTNEYVSNTDFHTRTLMITDENNNSSILIETFGYSDEKDFSEKHIYTKSITGSLPNGIPVALDYGYFFSGR
jgi:hypothetical protein